MCLNTVFKYIWTIVFEYCPAACANKLDLACGLRVNEAGIVFVIKLKTSKTLF